MEPLQAVLGLSRSCISITVSRLMLPSLLLLKHFSNYHYNCSRESLVQGSNLLLLQIALSCWQSTGMRRARCIALAQGAPPAPSASPQLRRRAPQCGGGFPSVHNIFGGHPTPSGAMFGAPQCLHFSEFLPTWY